jgi:molybdenum cofactor cytidylyltransferase
VIAGVILAAGASKRMGSPKALLSYQGETFLTRLARVLGSVCEPVVVVLGHNPDAIRPHVPRGARVVVNPDPDRGQLSSLQTALAALPPDIDGFAFVPVDCPAVAEATVARLAGTFASRDRGSLFVIPRKDGRRGHPVLADRRLIVEFLALPPAAEAREIVHAHVAETEYVEVDDDGIFADIDTPEAYRRLKVAP